MRLEGPRKGRMDVLVAVLIFLVTIILVIWQPRGLGIGWSAMLGAVLALLSGVVHLGDILTVGQIVWNAMATLIAIIIISLCLMKPVFSSGRPCTRHGGAMDMTGCYLPWSSCSARRLLRCFPMMARR